MESIRPLLTRIFAAGIRAVAPDTALLRHVCLENDSLCAGKWTFPLAERRVFVLGGGKGAAPMATAIEKLLGSRIHKGLVVVKSGHTLPSGCIRQMEAAHPVPDHCGQLAAEEMLGMAAQARKDDLVICLFTGGASALTPAPVAGISLEELGVVTGLLLRCGATINELNAVRKHLSRFSGGQLARAASPAQVLTLIVSDVVGDALDVIASGPTVPDSSTFQDCRSVFARYNLEADIPAAVLRHVAEGCDGRTPETPKADDACFNQVYNLLVATNRQALEASAAEAEACGYAPCILTDTMTGEARQRAVELVGQARDVARTRKPGDRPVCLLAGGETTVTIRGEGKGGRNQEMALAAALELEGQEDVAALFAGTDGTDGPTDAAGGFAFAGTAARIRAGGDPVALLRENNSNTALAMAGDLLITGPTRTNVMDMAILLIQGDSLKPGQA